MLSFTYLFFKQRVNNDVINTSVFQQDSAPARRARDTIELLRDNTPDFIAPDMWPPNSPDLNPVDYVIWSVTDAGACVPDQSA